MAAVLWGVVSALMSLVSIVVAEGNMPKECKVTLDGIEWIDVSTYHQAFASKEGHFLIPFRAANAPCKGFLTNDTYYLRARASDHYVVEAVFAVHEFHWLNGLFPGDRALNIVDLGGNGGYAAAYFASRYPKGRVVTVEPFLSNFCLATLNNARHQNAAIVLGAVASKDAFFEIQSQSVGWGEWAIRVSSKEDIGGMSVVHPVPGYSMATLMHKFSMNRIDFLKVDIEGAELMLFSAESLATGWLSKVGCFSIEFHDWRWSLGDCRTPVEAAILPFGFEHWFMQGELNIYCQKGSATTIALGLEIPDPKAKEIYKPPPTKGARRM